VAAAVRWNVGAAAPVRQGQVVGSTSVGVRGRQCREAESEMEPVMLGVAATAEEKATTVHRRQRKGRQ
jgi:hypothetical protein